MPRSVEITVPSHRRAALLERLEETDGIAAILVLEGAAHRPPGDVIIVRGTNQAAEHATRLAAESGLLDEGCMAITEPVGLVSGERRRQLDADTSEATWEEMDTLLRRDASPSHNYFGLMGMAGAIAGAGLYLDTLHIVIGAMLIAPGFEPLVRISVGVSAGLWDTARRGVSATAAGYLAMAFGAALGMLVAAWADPDPGLSSIADRHWVRYWTEATWTGLAVALMAGLAGGIVVNSHQTVFATGVMIALALIPAASILGMGLALGQVDLASAGLLRWSIDAGCVLAASTVVFCVKRALVGRGAHP